MTTTAHLALPFIDAAQSQKHVTHNAALEILDALAQIAVLARGVTAPPATPAEGDRHLLGAGCTGAFLGHDGQLAAWQAGAWNFCAPQAGWIAYVVAEKSILAFDGAAWNDLGEAIKGLDDLGHLGIGAAYDGTNPLLAKLNVALFTARGTAEGGTGDLRITLNKQESGNTASFLFQDGYSGRAEIGLSGDDGLHFKTSPDGSTWRESLRTDPATGAVLFPSGAVSASPVVDNPVVNSTFELWMAGTTFSVAANAYGVRIADGWVANNGPSGVAATVSQAPAPVGMPGRLACNLSATGVAQNGFLDVCQRFEGQRVAHLDSVAGTVSFWVAGATTGGTLAGSVYLLGNGALDNGTYSVGLVGGGIAFVVPAVAGRVTVPLTAAQTAGLKLGAELYVRITQTGAAGNPNVTFGACQWDLGPVAQPFVPRPIEREIPLCQRYYQAGASALYRAAAVASLNGGMTAFALPTPMRAAPTVTTAVTSGPTAVPAVSASPTALRFWWGATGVAGDVQTFNYTLDARL